MNMTYIVSVTHSDEKAAIVKAVLADLPEWFGLPDSTREYIEDSRRLPLWAAMQCARPIGFVTRTQTSARTAEVHCMGVRKEAHRQGIGRDLLTALEKNCAADGYRLLQVKTVDEGHYPEYDRTIAFYEAMGFVRLEVFPTLWDAWNPCLVLVKPL